jgi:hypothetical protein
MEPCTREHSLRAVGEGSAAAEIESRTSPQLNAEDMTRKVSKDSFITVQASTPSNLGAAALQSTSDRAAGLSRGGAPPAGGRAARRRAAMAAGGGGGRRLPACCGRCGFSGHTTAGRRIPAAVASPRSTHYWWCPSPSRVVLLLLMHAWCPDPGDDFMQVMQGSTRRKGRRRQTQQRLPPPCRTPASPGVRGGVPLVADDPLLCGTCRGGHARAFRFWPAAATHSQRAGQQASSRGAAEPADTEIQLTDMTD